MICELQHWMTKGVDFVLGAETPMRNETNISGFIFVLLYFIILICILGVITIPLRYILNPILQKRFYCKRRIK